MITEAKISDLINEHLEGTTIFLVEMRILPSNGIRVKIDSDEGAKVTDCMALSRHIEGSFDREEEDFDLEVSTPGLSEPLKVHRQYAKSIGRDVKVLMENDKSIEGNLINVTDNGIVVETKVKERIEGRKAKQWVITVHDLIFSEIKQTKVKISFK